MTRCRNPKSVVSIGQARWRKTFGNRLAQTGVRLNQADMAQERAVSPVTKSPITRSANFSAQRLGSGNPRVATMQWRTTRWVCDKYLLKTRRCSGPAPRLQVSKTSKNDITTHAPVHFDPPQSDNRSKMKKFFAISLVAASATFGSVQAASAQSAPAEFVGLTDIQRICEVNPGDCQIQLLAILDQLIALRETMAPGDFNRYLGQIATIATLTAQAHPELRVAFADVIVRTISYSSDSVQQAALGALHSRLLDSSDDLSSVVFTAFAGSPS